jgi:hypothetical protein
MRSLLDLEADLDRLVPGFFCFGEGPGFGVCG